MPSLLVYKTPFQTCLVDWVSCWGVVKPGMSGIGTISSGIIDMNWRSTIVRARGGRVDIIQYSKTALAHQYQVGYDRGAHYYSHKPTVDLNAVTQGITEIVQEVVAPQLDRTLPIEVEASSIAETASKVIVHVHIKDDANEMSVRDKIA